MATQNSAVEVTAAQQAEMIELLQDARQLLNHYYWGKGRVWIAGIIEARHGLRQVGERAGVIRTKRERLFAVDKTFLRLAVLDVRDGENGLDRGEQRAV